MENAEKISQDRFIRDRIVPILSDVELDEDVNKRGGKIDFPLSLAFFGFIAAFLLVRYLLPDNGIGNTLAFIAFPLLFLASLALTAFLYRGRIAEMFVAGHQRFLIRARALHAMADYFGLDYVPLPGGPSPAFKMIANWRYCPHIVKEIFVAMDDHGGFDDISEIVRTSGLAVPSQAVLGSKETKEKYYAEHAKAQQYENGVRGERNGMPFAALEWTENGDETNTHHCLIALTLPTKLTGRTEFKTRKAGWPAKGPNLEFENVELVSSDFKRNFKVRATDQMEARFVFDPAVIARLTDYAEAKMGAQALQAGGEKIKIRGSVFGNHLVVDFIGENRFDLLDLASGEWDMARIQKTMEDFKDILALVGGLAGVFDTHLKPAAQPARHVSAA